MKYTKPKLLLGLYNQTATKGLMDSSSIDDLKSKFDIDIVYVNRLPEAIEQAHEVLQWPETKNRTVAWQALYLSELLPFTRLYYPERMGDVNLWHGYAHIVKWIVPALIDNQLVRPFAQIILRWALHKSNPLKSLITKKYDAIACITGLKDPMYEDLVRYGEDMEVPVLGITQNWDNINYKPMVVRPTRIGVWGEQGYYVARMVHHFSHFDIALLGAARMDVYFELLPEQSAARTQLGLPADKLIILFAGAGPAFEETSLIEQLDTAVGNGELPENTLILYKPHPRRMPRTHEKPIDAGKLKHVQIVPPEGEDAVSTADMPLLVRAVDGLTSPYSTLLLEGALCGRPGIALGYNHPDHAGINWSTVRTFVHFAPILFSKWGQSCFRKEDFLQQVKKLCEMTRNPKIEIEIRASVAHVLHHDGQSFGARIADSLIDMIKSKDKE